MVIDDGKDVVRRRTFEGDFIPNSMIFNGRKGRRIGCLLEDDLQRYMLVDIEGEVENDQETVGTIENV